MASLRMKRPTLTYGSKKRRVSAIAILLMCSIRSFICNYLVQVEVRNMGKGNHMVEGGIFFHTTMSKRAMFR